MANPVRVGGTWQHRNGNVYKVIALANTRTTRHEEYPITVVYKHIHNDAIWYRELSI